jgi:predicted nucleotidyltransferase
MKVADVHARSLATSATLTRYYMPDTILPVNVVKVLQRAKIPFVLAGAHGIFGWMGVNEARPTKDVDVIVAARYHRKAVRALVSAFPDLDPQELEVVTRLKKRGSDDILIDVMKPTALYRAAFKHTHSVTKDKLTFRVPSLEMALAMKFGPMVSLNRDEAKKHQDIHDFIMMVRANAEIDFVALKDLGNLVYQGGGSELTELVRKVRAGEKLTL